MQAAALTFDLEFASLLTPLADAERALPARLFALSLRTWPSRVSWSSAL